MYISPENMVYEELKLDGTGTEQVVANYAVTPGTFYIQPPSDETWVIRRMIGSYQDGGGGTMAEYGNTGGALSNGIKMKVFDSSGDIKVLNETAVVSNGHWARNCYDADRKDWGAGDDLFVFRWTFAKDVGAGIILDGAKGHRLGFVANDNYAGLVNHQYECRGYIVTPTLTLSVS